ncbi:uncharacterized protein N7500_003244, partial [Penicillium coprophilum]|uniref:uncharacterized protein n=1 Tax=Penicillium coprophilum TaxID=36646 RepID=UPI0023995043
VLLAIQAFKNRDISSISLTIRTFNIPRSTLRRRLSVREIANLLLEKRRTTLYPFLSSRFSKRYNYKCTKYKDPKIITKINPNNIYNFNKTSFIIGLIVTIKVIIRISDHFYNLEIVKSLLNPSLIVFRIISVLNGSSGSTYTPTAKKRFAGFITIYTGPTKGRLLLAIWAIKKQEIRTISAATYTFNIPCSTLHDRLNSYTEQSTIRSSPLALYSTRNSGSSSLKV